jgi:hypothetical protein
MKFDALEKMLNVASTKIEELSIDDYELQTSEVQVLPYTETALTQIEESTTEVFTLDCLKADFVIIRQNVKKLIATGQRVLDTVSVIDPSDLNAPQLKAIAEVMNSVGSNTELLIKIYKEITNIEKTRAGNKPKPNEAPGLVNQGSMTTNNIVFSGDTNQLLAFLKENKN